MRRFVPMLLLLSVLVTGADGPPSASARSSPLVARVGSPRLLYTSDWSGTREIYTIDPSHPGSIAQVTFGHEPSCDPLVVACGFSDVVPSPNGRHVAFESFDAYVTGSLYVSRPDGRARRRVARFDECSHDVAWAPDSRRFAYVLNCSWIYVARADGSGSRRLSYGRDPSWSPDGRSLALVDGRELWIARDGRFQRIANDVDSYAWSPTGKLLAIATSSTESHFEFTQVATIRPNGTDRRQLNEGSVVDGYVWSPSGRWLALSPVTHGNDPGELDIVRPNGTDRHRFTDRSVFTGWTWSSDDRYIGYEGYSGLTVLDVARATTTQLGPYTSNRWSRKGHLLAFSTASGISIFDPTNGTTHRLTPDRGSLISWAPDDRSIAYGTYDIRLVSLAGRVRTIVAGSGTAGGSIASVTWIKPTGPLHYRKPERRSVATVAADQLTAPWPIERIAADGNRVLYVTCGHLFLWTPATRDVVQAEPAASLTPKCSTPGHYLAFDVYDVALTGDRIAFGDRWGNMSQGWELYQQPLADPAAVQRVPGNDAGYAICTVGDAGLGDLAGAGDLLVFSRWHELFPPDQCGPIVSQQIYRLDAAGCPCPLIATAPGPLLPADADGGRIVAVGANETELLDSNGKQLLSVPMHAAAAQLSGSHLVVVVQGQLRDYDATTGALMHAWPLPDVQSGGPCGSPHGCRAVQLELEDAARDLAVYVLNDEVHVVQLQNGTDMTIGKGMLARFMDAGLVYADGANLRLVPFDQLPLR
jgi:Tol biopolymer transport system component